MGCLKSIVNKIILIALLVAFFFFGGCDFVVTKYNEFTSPPREVMIQQSKDFGDFSLVSSDFRLTRSINIGGYRKFNAQYMPTSQKITIIDLKDKDLISPSDFYSKSIDGKIYELLNNFKDSIITLEDLQITGRSTVLAKGKNIPCVNFKAKVKNIPFKTVEGTLMAYESLNTSSAKKNKPAKKSVKVIVSMRDANKYNAQITADFVKNIKF